MQCRVCQADDPQELGILKPYLDYECMIYQCPSCACRFSQHDKDIYEKLHSGKSTVYAFHRNTADQARKFFLNKQVGRLRKYLFAGSKNVFVIDAIENLFSTGKVLEIGCSWGYLTSYFLLKGYQASGVDISPSAITHAREMFGNHFYTPDAPEVSAQVPYDAIVHVGTIGCVESPLEMTRDLLAMLRPGGILVFNTPNVAACRQNELWIRIAFPPDIVTLFSEKFWNDNFNEIADVQIKYEKPDGLIKFNKLRNNLSGVAREFPAPQRKICEVMDVNQDAGRENPFLSLLKTPVKPVFKLLGDIGLFPSYVPEFGMHVTMVKK